MSMAIEAEVDLYNQHNKGRQARIFTKRTSEEGCGVVDLDRLYEARKLIGFSAEQLSYPEKENLYPGIFDDYLTEDHPSYDLLLEYLTQIEHKTLYERQTKYTETFDFQKDCTLFMTYVKFEDSKGRGQML